jgi:uncharacterized protein YigA (DUF484 family)
MTSDKRLARAVPDAEETVVDHLRDNPEFFDRHPELLENLVIPHSCGGAVSLVEYQVSVLRDQVHDLRRRMQSLVNNARDNENLSQRLHRLTLALMECNSLDDVFTTLYQALRDDFKAEFAVIRLLATPNAKGDDGLGEFLGNDTEARELFSQVLASGRPVCGRVKPELLSFLFPEQIGEVQSSALLSLGRMERCGVLAIGSRDAQRFHPGMGTIFLRQLGDIVSHVLAPHIAVA